MSQETPRHLRLIDRTRLKVQLQLEPRDLWIGAFWRFSEHAGYRIFHLYVCLIPCIPLHVSALLAERKEAP